MNNVSFGKDRGEVLKHSIQVHLHEKFLTESRDLEIKRLKLHHFTKRLQVFFLSLKNLHVTLFLNNSNNI